MMSTVAGYILILNDNRYSSFQVNKFYKFVEPVPEFNHSRNIPLICFITKQSGYITHIGLGARGMLAGTDLRKLNIEDIFELKQSVSAWDIADSSDSSVRHYIVNKVRDGGLLSTKCFEEFLRIFLEVATDAVPILGKYTKERRLRIENLPVLVKKSLAEQKEAVLTAMNIAGIDRDHVLGWDYNVNEEPLSYLDGLPQVVLREDAIVLNDLTNIPGFSLIKSTKYASSVFENDKTRLTVLLANRQPLEELLGTDLIYYNEDFKCFVMVQYKVMKKEVDTFRFRLPDQQFAEEISRMDLFYESIKETSGDKVVRDYRISENPFFIKICQHLEFNPDNVGLSTGMYIPLDYIKMLENDECVVGKQGGKSITYDNVGRYFDNTGFKTIIEGGWIGTNQNQSLRIQDIIKTILEQGKAAVIAIKRSIEK